MLCTVWLSVFFRSEENELRRKACWLLIEDSSWHHFHLMNTYIYMTVSILFKTGKTREELRVMHCSYLLYLVTIFALVVKVKDWAHPLGDRLYTVLPWPDILSISHSFGFVQIDSLHCFVWMELTELRKTSVFLSSVLSSQGMSLLCLPYICRLPLGLISSGRAKAVGHSISALCMLSVPALPFFSKGRGSNLGCPPARRKWVTDNPWTFPRGYSVALLQGHWHTGSAFMAAPETHLKAVYIVWILSLNTGNSENNRYNFS